MANTVGSINFAVGVDASRIAADLQRDITPALAKVQAELNRKPLTVPVKLDTSKINTAAIKSINQLVAKDVKINVDVNVDEAKLAALKGVAPALREIRNAGGDKSIKIKVDVDVDPVKAEMLRTIAPALRSLRDLSSKDIKIKVDVDFDAAKLEAVRAATSNLKDKNVKIGADSSSTNSAASSVDRLGGSLAGLAKYTGIGAAIGAGLAGIVGAAGAAAGAVGALALAAAAVGPAIGGIAGTALVGFNGIKDAFSALNDQTDSAGSDAKDQAKAIADAQDSLASAYDSTASAQDSLTSAQESASEAAKGVADAYKSAQERLDGYKESLQESNLDQREAALNLKEAQDALAKGGFKTFDDYQRAVLKVDRAQLNLQKSQEAGKKLQDQANDAYAKGVNQSDEVVAAKKKQADADRQVVAAQRGVESANRSVAKAQRDLADAQTSSSASADKFAQAMAKLSPNAQATVLAFKDLLPQLTAARKEVQDSLFANMATELKDTATAILPAVTEGMKGVASAMNAAGIQALQFLRSTQGIDLINATFASSRDLISGFTQNLKGASTGVVDFVTTAAPYAKSLGQGFADIANDIGMVFTAAKNSGQLDAIFSQFKPMLDGLGVGISGIVTALLDITQKVMPTLGPFFATLGTAIANLGPALGDIGATFVTSLTSMLPSLSELIKALATGLQPVLPVIANLFNALANALTPLMPIFSQILVTLGDTLITTINTLAPALAPLATAFESLLNAIAPIVPMIANNLAVVIEALAPALTNLFNALAPVIAQFAEQMGPVVAQLAPVLAEVANTIAQALVDAINQLAPLLPSMITAWTNLLLAIIPLLPQLIDLAVSVIPPLVDAMVKVAPVVEDMINAFTWFVEHVVNEILIPAIQGIQAYWGDMAKDIGDVVDWLDRNVFSKLGDVINNVKGWFSDGVTAIRNNWNELKAAAADPVNFVIDTVWNNGLLKAWRGLDNLLGGVLPDAGPIPLIPTRATGGPLNYFGSGGSGNGTKDDILFWGSNGEHVVTADEVMKAGGQDILYAIRDMISRGIPFSWDNGRIITDLGRSNLQSYGAAVAAKGIGNVSPEGLFDQLIPKHATGGQIMPWMNQLKAGHDFARAQDGKEYQWAGPRFVGDSFDCSGFMGSIIAAILGQNPWQRYWSTSTFSGYPAVGAQGLTKNLVDGSGMAVGITDDPGGPGGGHTAGELRGIPELGIAAARVESGGSIGNVHYGRGTNPSSFQSLYGLPIGANGFFQPSPGGGGGGPIGPSTSEQTSFLGQTIAKIVKASTDPIRKLITSVVGNPPPSERAIPVAVLDAESKAITDFATKSVGSLGGALGGAWNKAKSLGSDLLHDLVPFDTGGIATGTGYMAKNTIEPERVLSPEQTKLFEALVQALSTMAGTGLGGIGTAIGNVVVDISQSSISALQDTSSQQRQQDQTETVQAITRTASSSDAVAAITAKQQMDELLSIGNKLSGDILGPVLSSAVGAGTKFLTDLIDGMSKDVVGAVNGTTSAVTALGNSDPNTSQGSGTTPIPFGSPGSAFDTIGAISEAVQTVAKSAESAFNKVAQDVANAALAQTPSKVGNQSKGKLGEDDISGGYLVDFIVKLTGVDIEILNLLGDTYKEIQDFRKDAFTSTDENGQIVSDTAALVQRTATSMAVAAAETDRINKALIKSVIKYLITNILIPVITAILGAMITLATTAIGAAIGSAIPVIGTAIGAAVGAAVGAALTGLAAVFTSIIAVGAGAALDSFDEGGIAPGLGFMPKNTIAPERVLSPRQTTAFETLVGVLDRGSTGNRTVQIGSMNVNGRDPAQKTADNLLTLLNT